VAVGHVFYIMSNAVLAWVVIRAFTGDCGVTTSNKARGYHIAHWVCCLPVGQTTSLLLSLCCLEEELRQIVSLKRTLLFSHGLS